MRLQAADRLKCPYGRVRFLLATRQPWRRVDRPLAHSRNYPAFFTEDGSMCELKIGW
jgi:hypothetical protein